MQNLIDIVMRVNQAFLDKDEATLRAHLAPNYRYRGPIEAMNIDGIEACLTVMRGFELAPVNANSEWIVESDQVVEIFEWTLNDPVHCIVPMIEVTTFRNRQIGLTRAFFDPVLLPSLN